MAQQKVVLRGTGGKPLAARRQQIPIEYCVAGGHRGCNLDLVIAPGMD
jgi:hypothetical protein